VYHGWESERGPKEIERTPPSIYTIPGGESQWGGGPMDRMRLRSDGRDYNLQVPGFGVMTRAIRGHNPRVAGCQKS